MEEVLTDANAWIFKIFYVGSGNNGKTRMNDEKGISVPTDDPHFSIQYLLGHFGHKSPGPSLTVYLLSK
jgi:hypothetical protein